jgi:hypothetical protein
MKSNNLLTRWGLLAAIVGSIVILSSCSQDETAKGFSNPAREVTFSAYAKKGSLTRVAETTSQTITNFDVYGMHSVSGTYLDNMGGTGNNNAPAYVSGGNNAWGYSPKQLWPETGTIDFYAYSPGKNSERASTLSYVDEVITYTVPNRDKQEDLLVAVKPGVNCVTPGLVSLNFQHALSRIQLKARPIAQGAVYEISSVSFLNLYNSGSLALNTGKIPDGSGFAYNDNANYPGRTPLVLWTPTGSRNTKYEFDFSSNKVSVGYSDGEYTDVIVGNEAFLVLPQATELGATVAPGTTNDPSNGFYVKIVYTDVDANTTDAPMVKYFAVKEPLNPIMNAPLSFEIGRSYTFVVDLGSKYIDYADVLVAEFDNTFDLDDEIPINIDITPDPDPALNATYMPTSHRGFAGSNIYWDAEKQRLTFDDVHVTDHEQYQGVLFKWGSLIALNPSNTRSSVWNEEAVYYNPSSYVVNGGYTENDSRTWANIAAFVGNITDNRKSGFMTFLNTDSDNLDAYKGDVCAYLSGRPGIPAGHWRLPTSAEFLDASKYTRIEEGVEVSEINDFSARNSNRDEGTFVINNGYIFRYGGGENDKTFFPASGYRDGNGAMFEVGQVGAVWSSSPSGGASYYLRLDSGLGLDVNITTSRTRGYSVRCVKK